MSNLQKSACESASKMALDFMKKNKPEKTRNSSKIPPKKLKTAKVLSLEYQNGR